MFCNEKGQDGAFGGDALSRWAASFQVELKESGKNILIAQIFRPAVGGEHGVVEFAVGVLQSGGIIVVQVRQGVPFQFRNCRRGEIGVAYGAATTVRSLTTCPSRPLQVDGCIRRRSLSESRKNLVAG